MHHLIFSSRDGAAASRWELDSLEKTPTPTSLVTKTLIEYVLHLEKFCLHIF